MSLSQSVEVTVYKWDPTILTGELTDDDVAEQVFLQEVGQETRLSAGEGLDGQEVFVLFRAMQGLNFYWETENRSRESEIDVEDMDEETEANSGESEYIVVANWNKGIKVIAVQTH